MGYCANGMGQTPSFAGGCADPPEQVNTLQVLQLKLFSEQLPGQELPFILS